MIYVVRINDKEYEVEVERGKATILRTTTLTAVPPKENLSAPMAVKAQPAPAEAAPAVKNDVKINGGIPVKAPMPGIILDVKVNSGSSVKKGDVLVILEAMKMENEILAPEDGVIEQVLVSRGKSVETNDILLVIR